MPDPKHSTLIEDVKQDAKAAPVQNILEIVGSQKATAARKWSCPFCGGSDPLHDYGSTFKCFSCGKQGDVIELVMQSMSLDYLGALEWITRKTLPRNGEKVPRSALPRKRKSKPKPKQQPQQDPRDPTPEQVEIWNLVIASCLEQDQSPGHEYLRTRGIDPDWAQEKLDFVWMDSPRASESYLLQHGVDRDAWVRAGLTRKNGEFLYWKPLMIFPFRNANDSVIYLEGHFRKQDRNSGGPKSLSLTSEVDRPLWGLNWIVDAKEGTITEGVIDAVSVMLVAETESVCAITGASSFNSHHGESLGHLKKLTILADSDDAGEQLKLRILRHTGGCVTDFRKYPDGCKDGNDWLLMEAQK